MGGRAACVVLLAAFAAGLTSEVYRLCRGSGAEAGRGRPWAWAAAAGPPVAAYAFHLYTEVPSAWALCACLPGLLTSHPPQGPRLGRPCSPGALPWLHTR